MFSQQGDFQAGFSHQDCVSICLFSSHTHLYARPCSRWKEKTRTEEPAKKYFKSIRRDSLWADFTVPTSAPLRAQKRAQSKGSPRGFELFTLQTLSVLRYAAARGDAAANTTSPCCHLNPAIMEGVSRAERRTASGASEHLGRPRSCPACRRSRPEPVNSGSTP